MNKRSREEEQDIESGFEPETEEDYSSGIGYDADDIRIDQKNFPVFQICRWISNGDLVLNPDFQRNFVWDRKKQSLLIESLMLRIPIPAFYFNEDEKGYKIVIDGLQRLTTIFEFCSNKFKLQSLEYLTECKGLTFEQLGRKYQRRIEDTQLSINVLDARCPNKVKFDVFRRINTGGVQLNAQEVRNIMAADKTRELLRRMVSCKIYQETTGNRVKDTRMKSQELCLRYVAYRMRYDDEKKCISSFMPLKEMLDQSILDLNDMDEKMLNEIHEEFEQSMERCFALMGELAFSKAQDKKVINRALFISFSVVMAGCNKSVDELAEKSEKAKIIFRKYVESDKEYADALSLATSSKKSIDKQFEMVNRLLEELF